MSGPRRIAGIHVCALGAAALALLGGMVAIARPAVEEPPAVAAPVTYQVIVHPRMSSVSVDRKFLLEAFLRKVTRWPASGAAIMPVDQQPGSPVRKRFSDEVLRRSVAAVKTYWQQQVFSGREIPPPELDTEEEVVRYVLRYEGAVGYVSTSVELRGAKILAVR